jgi:regulator of nucleoside diphosphate kinase
MARLSRGPAERASRQLLLFSVDVFYSEVNVRQYNIIISSADHDRLIQLIDSARLDWRIPRQSLDVLEGELGRATIVEPARLPRDVIAMNSTVCFRDLDTEEIERYQLVFPPDADVVHQRISVLAPIGTALLGFRRGDTVEWQVPQGRRRLQITKVTQKQAAHQTEPTAALA